MMAIVSVLGSLLGMIAAWYLNKIIRIWYQDYLDWRAKRQMDSLREDSVKRNQDANKDSDALAEIDGRK